MLEWDPHGVNSSPHPFGLIKNRYDASDRITRPCHTKQKRTIKLQHLDLLTARNLPVFFQAKYESYTLIMQNVKKRRLRVKVTYYDKDDLKNSTSFVSSPVGIAEESTNKREDVDSSGPFANVISSIGIALL